MATQDKHAETENWEVVGGLHPDELPVGHPLRRDLDRGLTKGEIEARSREVSDGSRRGGTGTDSR